MHRNCDALCLPRHRGCVRLRHIERIFNRFELYELLARHYPRSGMRDRKFYTFRYRGNAGVLPIICISGVYPARAKKCRRWGAHACDFAHTLTLFRTRIAYVPETTYIRSHDSGGDPRIDTYARNVIHTGCTWQYGGITFCGRTLYLKSFSVDILSESIRYLNFYT